MNRKVGLAVLLVLFLGCNSEPPELCPVRGKVFYRDVPLREGTVVFTPDAERGGNGPLARAEIEPDGSYVLKTDDRPGAVPGWHRITVLAIQPATPSQGHYQRRALIPSRYSDPDLSGLSYQVKPDKENAVDLRLE